jgi:Uma2 family endonuclease
MTATIAPAIHYPSGDGQPVAETFDHLYVILVTIAVLRQHLRNEQACVLGNQFLYYAQGFPRLRCAPDVMVIFGVEPGSRDNYKIWDEGQVPRVVFEITSPGTRKEDDEIKKLLYEQLGIEEYWQFDPRGEWIAEKLRGYRLVGDDYVAIANDQSEALGLRLAVDGPLIAFYRLDNGEKLLIPDELYDEVEQLKRRTWQLQEQTQQLQDQNQQLQDQLNAERAQAQRQLDDLQQQLDRYQEPGN